MKNKNVPINNEDKIVVQKMSTNKVQNIISVEGKGIKTPGTYKYNAGMTVKDVIQDADGIYPDALMTKIDLIRTNSDMSTSIISLNLKDILDGKKSENIALKPLDRIIFYSEQDLAGEKCVFLEGHVKKPGEYEYHENLSLYDLIITESGLSDTAFAKQAYLRQANIFRINLETQKREIIPFNLGSLLAGDLKQNILLKRDDIIRIYDLESILRNYYVTITGEIKKPGRYKLAKNMDLNSLVIDAGGLTNNAMASNMEIGRQTKENDLISKKSITVDFDTLEGKTFLLKNNDYIIVKADPYLKEKNSYVTITGEVNLPGNYNYINGEKIDNLIKKVGGLKKSAFIDGAQFYRNDSRAQIELAKAMEYPDTEYNFSLHPGDKLIIPKKDNFITVNGAVTAPGRILYHKDKSADFYIEMAGGYKKNANKSEVGITTPYGHIIPAWNTFWFNPTVTMGSTINVP